MLFKNIFSIALLSSAAAAEQLNSRDLPTITGALDKVTADISSLNTLVNSFGGQTAGVAPITQGAQTIILDITSGTRAVTASSNISIFDALNVITPAQNLLTASQGLADAIIVKKTALDQASASAGLLQQLQAMKTGATPLAAAVAARLPDFVAFVATGVGSAVVTQLDRGITALSSAPLAAAPPAASPRMRVR